MPDVTKRVLQRAPPIPGRIVAFARFREVCVTDDLGQGRILDK
jgi:hypothetical protein